MKEEQKIIMWSMFQGCDISISPLVLNSSIPLLCTWKINKTTKMCDHRNLTCGTVLLKIYWFLGTCLLDMHLHHISNLLYIIHTHTNINYMYLIDTAVLPQIKIHVYMIHVLYVVPRFFIFAFWLIVHVPQTWFIV